MSGDGDGPPTHVGAKKLMDDPRCRGLFAHNAEAPVCYAPHRRWAVLTRLHSPICTRSSRRCRSVSAATYSKKRCCEGSVLPPALRRGAKRRLAHEHRCWTFMGGPTRSGIHSATPRVGRRTPRSTCRSALARSRITSRTCSAMLRLCVGCARRGFGADADPQEMGCGKCVRGGKSNGKTLRDFAGAYVGPRAMCPHNRAKHLPRAAFGADHGRRTQPRGQRSRLLPDLGWSSPPPVRCGRCAPL